MAATWAAIIGLEPPVATADGAAIAFSSRTIQFVPARDGRTGIVAVDVHATDRDHGVGQAGELCHTLIRFEPIPGPQARWAIPHDVTAAAVPGYAPDVTDALGDPGVLIGRGRAADVYALEADRVLRRYRTPYSCAAEADLMRYLRRPATQCPRCWPWTAGT